MRIDFVHLQNFISHEDSKVILADRGLLLLDGCVGSGKSSILEAITWVLFGTTSRGIKTDSVIRRNSGGNTHGHVRITLDDNTVIDAHRYRQHTEFKNKFILLVDGKDITKDRDDATTQLLEQYLKIDYSTFSSVVLFAQGATGFASMTDAEQKAVFERVLDLGRFAQAHERTKDLLKELNLAIIEATSEINFLKKSKSDCQSRIKELDTLESKFTRDKEAEIQALENKLIRLQDSEPSTADLDKQIELLNDLITQSDVTDLNDLREQAKKQIQQLAIEQAQYTTQIDMLQKKRKGLVLTDVDSQLEYSPNCPTCGQPMPETATEHMRDSIDAQNDLVRKEILQLRDELDDIAVKQKKIKEQTEAQRLKVQKVDGELEDYNDLIYKQQSLREDRRVFELRFQDWQRSFSDTRETLMTARKKTSPYLGLQDKEFGRLEKMAADLDKKEAELNDNREEVKYLDLCERMFSNKGLKSFILDTVTPYLNHKANEYFYELTDGKGRLKFSTQVMLNSGEKRDKFHVEVSYTDGADNYIGVSGGERRKADICIILALNDLVATRSMVPIRLKLFDELCDGLDKPSISKVIRLLQKQVQAGGTIIFMSHNEDLKDLFDNVVSVRKENGVSRLQDCY